MQSFFQKIYMTSILLAQFSHISQRKVKQGKKTYVKQKIINHNFSVSSLLTKLMWLTFGVVFSANQKLQRVANPLLHLISPTGGVLCVEHVCGGGGGELPQGQGSTAGRGGSLQGTPPSSQNCKEEKKLV